MYTKDDLVTEFSKYCEDIAATFKDVVDDLAEKDGQSVSIMVETLSPSSLWMDVWWDETNKSDFLMQRSILAYHHPDYLKDMNRVGLEELQDNPHHYAFFCDKLEEADRLGFEPFFVDRLIPHEVGAKGCGYGSVLRDTQGYKELDFLCKAMGNTDIIIHVTNDPEINELLSAFCLAIEVRSTDGKRLKEKMSQPHIGQILALKGAAPN